MAGAVVAHTLVLPENTYWTVDPVPAVIAVTTAVLADVVATVIFADVDQLK